MREIKFRMYDGDDMFELNPVWFEENCYDYEDFSKCAKERGCELMQYTGFKDMDGKEIYEGDFIDFAGLGPYEIKFIEGKFIDLPYKSLNFTTEGMSHFAKVVGNIFENPELIKEKE